jgi:beta-lactamase class A
MLRVQIRQFWVVCLLVVMIFPGRLAAQDLLASLDSCRFNAYTERDDLIIGAVILNFETGAGCTQNLNTSFPFASVGKLFIAGAFYQEVANGRLSFDQTMEFTRDYLMDGRDACLDVAQVGERFTLGFLGNIMISCSDNSATWMIMDQVGWDTVNEYAQSLGIAGIGEVIPYSEVDRLKLSLIDARWESVPRHLASQFYRRRWTDDLVPRYFASPPRYQGQEIRAANQQYLETYTYNTATPNALASYILKLRADLQSDDPVARQVAQWTFNTMLLTQRQFATQTMPGTVYVGSKNGFDLGYRAEVNITVNSVEDFTPQTLALVFVRHREVLEMEFPFRFVNVPTSDFLLDLAPHISAMLYPNLNATLTPTVQSDDRVRDVVVSSESALFPCYDNFLGYDFLDGLQRCWNRAAAIDRIGRGQNLGIGMVLRGMSGSDARVTLIFARPDGSLYSYQIQRFFENNTAIAWFEEMDTPGTWRVDVFFNLVPVFSQRVFVE